MNYDHATQDELKQPRNYLQEAKQATMQFGIIGITAALTVAFIFVLTK